MEAERPNEKDATSKQVETDAMLEKAEEPNKVDVRGQQAERLNQVIMTRRSNAKELRNSEILH